MTLAFIFILIFLVMIRYVIPCVGIVVGLINYRKNTAYKIMIAVCILWLVASVTWQILR